MRSRKGRRSRGGKRAKWRQQKLAVGTVQKIARQIAKAEDNKHIQFLVNQKLLVTGPWPDITQAPRESSKEILQPNAINWSYLSQIGNLTESNLVSQHVVAGGNTVQPDRTNEYMVKAAELNLAFENNTFKACRIRVEMCYVENLTQRTQDVVDYLTPSPTSFHGGVNLKFAGMFKKFQKFQGTGVHTTSPTYQLLAAKEFILPACKASTRSVGGVLTDCNAQVRKYVTLRKYWKRPKKLIWKSFQQGVEITGSQLCDGGNIIIQVMSDSEFVVGAGDVANPIGVRYWGTSGLRYFIKAGHLDNFQPTI